MEIRLEVDQPESADIEALFQLTKNGAPWVYNAAQPGDVTISAWVGGSTVVGIDATLTALGSRGLHHLLIPTAAFPPNKKEFAILVQAPAGAFDEFVIADVVLRTPVEETLSSIQEELEQHQTDLMEKVDAMTTTLEQVLAVSEYNHEITYTWNDKGTRVDGVMIKMRKDDQAVDFSRPDKQLHVSYTYHDTTGKLLTKTVREVAL